MKPQSFVIFTVGYTLLIICVPAMIWWGPDLKADEWAAWVQAVGSILAIVAAAWIAAHDRHEQNRLKLVDDLEGTAVVFEQCYWLATRVVLKLPQRPNRRQKAQQSWKRVKPQWTDTINHVRQLTPILPEQFNAQLVVAARLGRLVELYDDAIAGKLHILDLLELDKSAGRVLREVRQLQSPFRQRDAKGPLSGVAPDLMDHLCIHIDATLAAFGADCLAGEIPNQIIHAHLLDAVEALFERRKESLERLTSSQGGAFLAIKRDLASACEAVTTFIATAREDPSVYRSFPSPFESIPVELEAIRERALRLPIPEDRGS